jgi:bifunctional enzyme CysN/CysC
LPGHEQYTRNMATGASTADVAVVLVDARKGLLTQTRRHSYIVSLLGIRHVVLAVNKMDLVGYDQSVFDEIVAGYRELAAQLGIAHVTAIPLSALQGDNLLQRSPNTPWYRGRACSNTSKPSRSRAHAAHRLPPAGAVGQPPNQDFRGFAGTIAAGGFGRAMRSWRCPRAGARRWRACWAADGDCRIRDAGQAITLTLADELDISRGDVIAAATSPAGLRPVRRAPAVDGRTAAAAGSSVLAQDRHAHGQRQRHRDQAQGRRQHAGPAGRQAPGAQRGRLLQPLPRPAIAFEAYADNRELGGFILIDRQTNATVAAGTLDFALRRAGNIHWQHVDVDKAARARSKAQVPRCVWFTGLSGSGKSTVANLVEKRLHAMGHHCYILDGDNVRHGLNKDLGFTDEDRVENIRRVAEVARLMVDAGLIVLVSFISPFRAERRMAREMFDAGEFVEVFVDTPLAVAEQRDVKGLYAKARAGRIPNFTGIDSPYEAPEHAELVLDTVHETPETLAEQVIARLLGMIHAAWRRPKQNPGSCRGSVLHPCGCGQAALGVFLRMAS